MTIGQALQHVRQQLTGISDAPDIDAERLLLWVLDKGESSWLFAHSHTELTEQQLARLTALASERATGKPLAYIVGYVEFYGRDFVVTPDVLIPRPSTEDLIDLAIEKIHQLHSSLGRPLVIADIGTGSGCIAVTLVLETAMDEIGHIYAADVSPGALAVARQNAERYNVSNRITFFEGNMIEPLRDKRIDLLVSNPPYIPTAELDRSVASLTTETRGLKFEPHIALDGGNDGNTYLNQLKQSGIPLVAEIQSGAITVFNL